MLFVSKNILQGFQRRREIRSLAILLYILQSLVAHNFLIRLPSLQNRIREQEAEGTPQCVLTILSKAACVENSCGDKGEWIHKINLASL